MTELEKIRLSRRRQTGEDFTPLPLVSEMLDKLPKEVWEDPIKTFCDPAGGSGNFLVVVLERKLAQGHDPLQALSTIFSVELMPDNVEEMKNRLIELIPLKYHKKAWEIVNRNIICHDSLTWDFENWRSNNIKAKSLF